MSGFVNPDGSELVGGQKPGGVGQALQLDSSGNLLINVLTGSAMSVQDWIRTLIAQGQGFNLTTGKVTNSAAGNFPAVLLNPANSTKNLLVYSIKLWFQGGSNTHELRLLTADPAYTSLTSSIQNLKIGAATTSVAVAEYSTTTITPSGTVLDCGAIPTYTVLEFLSNGTTLLLPAAQASIQGLVAIAEPSQAGTWGITYRWVEF